jgi:tRNA(Leu) C34 or U34 (ribose-2'-O)-methylase TrmL
MSGFAAIALVNPKKSANVGGVMRAAHCFRAALVVLAGSRPSNYIKRIPADTTKTWTHLPILQVDDPVAVTPFGAELVAVEIVEGAKQLHDFHHPKRGYYLFGPEDGSIPKDLLEKCPHKVQIDTRHCMNLAATVNVVLYDRLAKEMRNGNGNDGRRNSGTA